MPAIAAAEANGATLLFPGSVWNYGRGMPPVLDENTPMQPTTRKGRMRVEIEQRIREACDRGMRAIVLRAGDFFGAGRGSWFDLVVVKELAQNRITYPGPDDVVHAWAYLPGPTPRPLVRLAERREDFAAFETFGFPGHALTGREMIDAIEAATRNKFNVRHMSWWMLKTFGQLHGARPRTGRARVSVAGAAPDRRREAQSRDRRRAAHAVQQGDRDVAARTWAQP